MSVILGINAMHAGAAATARDELAKLSVDEREAVLACLRSL